MTLVYPTSNKRLRDSKKFEGWLVAWSFVHSFVRSFVRSCVRAFVRSFIRLFARSLPRHSHPRLDRLHESPACVTPRHTNSFELYSRQSISWSFDPHLPQRVVCQQLSTASHGRPGSKLKEQPNDSLLLPNDSVRSSFRWFLFSLEVERTDVVGSVR